MTSYEQRGAELRAAAKTLVLQFMKASPQCDPRGDGIRQAELFRQCGLNWGEYPKATSTNQQYWIVALLRELESEEGSNNWNPAAPGAWSD